MRNSMHSRSHMRLTDPCSRIHSERNICCIHAQLKCRTSLPTKHTRHGLAAQRYAASLVAQLGLPCCHVRVSDACVVHDAEASRQARSVRHKDRQMQWYVLQRDLLIMAQFESQLVHGLACRSCIIIALRPQQQNQRCQLTTNTLSMQSAPPSIRRRPAARRLHVLPCQLWEPNGTCMACTNTEEPLGLALLHLASKLPPDCCLHHLSGTI